MTFEVLDKRALVISRSRAFTVLVGVLLLGACKSDAAVARGQVEDWATRWRGHRECLVGVAPVSADIEEAIELRAVADAGFAKAVKTCGPFAPELGRESSNHSGSTAIEARWLDLENAVKRLDTAHAAVVSGESELVRLARAADAVERHYASLRDLTGLSPDVIESAPIPALPIVAPFSGPDGTPVRAERLDIGQRFIVAWAAESSTTVAARISGPDQTSITRFASNAFVAADTVPWGIWVDAADRLVTGPFDEAGTGMPGAVPLAHPDMDAPKIALGDGARRWILRSYGTYRDDGTVYVVSSSTDGGLTWSDTLLPGASPDWDYVRSDWGERRVDFVSGNQEKLVWQSIRAGAGGVAEPRSILPAGARGIDVVSDSCFSGGNGWWQFLNQSGGRSLISFVSADAETPPRIPTDSPHDWDAWYCQGDKLATATHVLRLEVHFCNPESCGVVVNEEQPLQRSLTLLSERHGFVLVGFAKDVLFVYRPAHKADGRIPVFRVPNPDALVGLIDWADVVYAIFHDDTGVRAVPIPMRRTSA
jgi:hypothetical protein